LFAYADSLVCYFNRYLGISFRRTILLVHRHIDHNVGGSVGKLNRVSNQVYQHLLHTVDIDFVNETLAFCRIVEATNQVNIFVLCLDFHNFQGLFNDFNEILSSIVGDQQLLLKKASVKQILHKEFHHICAVFYHLSLLRTHFVCPKELNKDVCKINYAVERSHHLVRNVGGQQTEKVVLSLQCAYLLQAC